MGWITRADIIYGFISDRADYTADRTEEPISGAETEGEETREGRESRGQKGEGDAGGRVRQRDVGQERGDDELRRGGEQS